MKYAGCPGRATLVFFTRILFVSQPPISGCPNPYPSLSDSRALKPNGLSTSCVSNLISVPQTLFDPSNAPCVFSHALVSDSDIGSSISRRIGSQPPMSVYDPYAYRRYPSYGAYPRQYSMYGVQGVPVAQSYYSYAPSTAYAPSYATYADHRYTTGTTHSGGVHENMYFSHNGKLIRSYKVRNYKVSLSLDL